MNARQRYPILAAIERREPVEADQLLPEVTAILDESDRDSDYRRRADALVRRLIDPEAS